MPTTAMFPGVRDDIDKLRADAAALRRRLVVLAEEEDRLEAVCTGIETIIRGHVVAVMMNQRAKVQGELSAKLAAVPAGDTREHLVLVGQLLRSVDPCLHVSRRTRGGHYIVIRRCVNTCTEGRRMCMGGRPQILVDPNGDVYNRDDDNAMCNLFTSRPDTWNDEIWSI